jgi:hypothetical protein
MSASSVSDDERTDAGTVGAGRVVPITGAGVDRATVVATGWTTTLFGLVVVSLSSRRKNVIEPSISNRISGTIKKGINISWARLGISCPFKR